MKAPAAVSGRVVRVKLLHSSETCLCVPLPSEAIDLEDGAAVIVPTRHGSEIGLRIELQQIGMRDETRIVGGAGVCGRVLCCNGVTDRRPRVTVRMAREQGLSLDTRRISGQCGRLLCCLSYEYEFYEEVRRSVPKEGKSVYYQSDRFRVIELNALTGRARISGAAGVVLGVDFGDFRFDEANRRWEVSPV
jgi:cell fate regulator YaaT (PSP1 superfamily)